MKRQAVWLVVGVVIMSGSCQGCPGDPGNVVPIEIGTLNPLFDRAGFAGLDGRVLDPDPRVEKLFRVELVLGVAASSIARDSIRAYAMPRSLPDPGDVLAPPPDLADSTEPLDPVPIVSVRFENRGGHVVALEALLDAHALEAHAGSDLVMQLDPTRWELATSTVDSVFHTPMRFTFHVSEEGPDGSAPYVGDVAAVSDRPIAQGLSPRALANVAPHSPVSVFFSEPMHSIAPLLHPQDPAGFQPRAVARIAGGFVELSSETEAGLVPGVEYTLTFVPPRFAALGPLAWGSEDLSGEPLAPLDRASGRGRAAASGRGAVDIRFRAAPVRIESPRPGEVVAGADGSMPLRFISAQDCDGESCSDAVYRVYARAPQPRDQVGGGWIEYARLASGDAGFSIGPGKTLVQGEILAPVDLGQVSTFPTEGVPIDIDIPLLDLICPGLPSCELDLRIDRCDLRLELCDLGDVIIFEIDRTPPPEPALSDIYIDDSDTNDGRIDRICVDMEAPDTTTVVIESSLGAVLATIELAPDDPDVTEEDLGDGRVRRCISNVPIPEALPGTARTINVRVFGTDPAGNVGPPRTVGVACQLPPRKFIGYGGRRSAMALDRRGIPHVVYSTNRGAGGADNEIVYSRWDPTRDEWTPEERADCLCGIDGSNECNTCDREAFGWTIDLALNWEDRPLVCYTRATTPRAEDGTTPMDWEYTTGARVWLATPDPTRGDVWTQRRLVAGAPTSPDRDPRNFGCAIAARRSRAEAGIGDYLVAYGSGSSDPSFRARVTAVYLTERRPTSFPIQIDVSAIVNVGVGAHLDVATDDDDKFWIAIGDGPLHIFGETVPGSMLSGAIEEVLYNPPPGHAFAAAYSPRVAARGDGELAVAFSDEFFRPRLLFRSRRAIKPTVELIVPSDDSIDAYNQTETEPVRGEDDSSGSVINRAGLASADFMFAGLPMDVVLPPTGGRPIVAWVASRPGGHDYNALLVARPAQELESFDFESIDGRLLSTGAVSMARNGSGAIRIVYHNGLGKRGNDIGEGSLAFYREEDEDEIDRADAHATRGDRRCFASSLFRHDDTTDIHSPFAALDDQSAALNPRAGVDLDPCFRTVDPGYDDEVAYQVVAAALRASGTPMLDPPRRYTSHYGRVPGEEDDFYQFRTNVQRELALELLRDILGDLTPLDGILPRTDGLSWNANLLLPFADELFTDENNRAGALDPLFLAFDELTDDLCGGGGAGPTCPLGVLGNPAARDVLACTAPGVMDRNPNPFYPGRFYSDSTIPISQLNGFDRLGFATGDLASLAEFGGTFDTSVASDDAMAVGLATGETPGMVRDALRGMIIRGTGLYRRSDHVCQSRDGCGAHDAPLALLPRVFPPGVSEATVLPRAGDFDTGQQPGDPRTPSCPAIRPGHLTQFATQERATRTGVPQSMLLTGAAAGLLTTLSRVGSTSFACCYGYAPIECGVDQQCGLARGRCNVAEGKCHSDASVSCSGDADCPAGDLSRFCQDGHCVRSDADGAFVPVCRSTACTQAPTFYCDHNAPEAPNGIAETLCGALAEVPDCPSDITDPSDCAAGCTGAGAPECRQILACRRAVNYSRISTALAVARNSGCAPGATCTPRRAPDIEHTPAPLARQLLGHFGVRALGPLVGDRLSQSVNALTGVVGASHTWQTSAVHAAPVPEGLLVAIAISDTYIALVRHDGEIIRMNERPYADPEGWRPDSSRLVPVPGRRQFWVVNNRRDYRGGYGDVVLYSYDESGFSREAAGETPFIGAHVALASGELVAFLQDPPIGASRFLGRIRAASNGTIDLLEQRNFPIGAGVGLASDLGLIWPHHSDGFFLAVPFGAAVERGGQRYEHRDAWLVRVSANLEVISDPVRLGVEPFDPEYTGEPAYNHPTPRLIAAVPHPSGHVSLVSQGSLPRLGAAEGAHFWVQRVTPDGVPLHPNPGVLANRDVFVRSEDATITDGELPLVLITVSALPADHMAVGWWELLARGDDTLLSTRRAQVVRPDGTLDSPEPLDLGPPAGRYREVQDFRSVGAAQDGSGGAYGLYFQSDPGSTEMERRYSIGVEAYDEHLELLWPERVTLDTCEREAEGILDVVGDTADGVWMIWEEDLREASTGNVLSLLKIAWIRADGSFAWAGR